MSDADKDAGDTTVDKTVMTTLRDCTLVEEQNIKSTTIICYWYQQSWREQEGYVSRLWDAKNLEGGPSAGDILADLKKHVEIWIWSTSEGPQAGWGHLGSLWRAR